MDRYQIENIQIYMRQKIYGQILDRKYMDIYQIENIWIDFRQKTYGYILDRKYTDIYQMAPLQTNIKFVKFLQFFCNINLHTFKKRHLKIKP